MGSIEAKRRYRAKKHAEKYGEEAGDMRGRHGNHAKGKDSGRYNHGRLITSQGYVLVRVGKDHPHAFGPPGLIGAYAYEHSIVMMGELGRPLTANELVHHRDGNRQNNSPGNLRLKTRSGHAREHSGSPGIRDSLGRFTAGKPRPVVDPDEWPCGLLVREFPVVAHA